MKRSEMLKDLAVFIDTELFMDIDPEQADELLTFIEGKGMLPPTIENTNLQEIFENVWEKES